MTVHELAGEKAPKSILTNIPDLVSSYYTDETREPVSFAHLRTQGFFRQGKL